jgi:hypothetical protein
VNKKKQKNSVNLGRAGCDTTGPKKQKFFAPLFFKKAAAFLLSAKPITLKPRYEAMGFYRCPIFPSVCRRAGEALDHPVIC